jgi:hypothetical protein
MTVFREVATDDCPNHAFIGFGVRHRGCGFGCGKRLWTSRAPMDVESRDHGGDSRFLASLGMTEFIFILTFISGAGFAEGV